MESRGYAGRESDPPAPPDRDAREALERLGEGEALDPATRARMERSLGTPLDGVRVRYPEASA